MRGREKMALVLYEYHIPCCARMSTGCAYRSGTREYQYVISTLTVRFDSRLQYEYSYRTSIAACPAAPLLLLLAGGPPRRRRSRCFGGTARSLHSAAAGEWLSPSLPQLSVPLSVFRSFRLPPNRQDDQRRGRDCRSLHPPQVVSAGCRGAGGVGGGTLRSYGNAARRGCRRLVGKRSRFPAPGIAPSRRSLRSAMSWHWNGCQ